MSDQSKEAEWAAAAQAVGRVVEGVQGVYEAKKKYGWITPYDFYNTYGCNYFTRFLERNPEFNTKEFIEFVTCKNRGDRDSGELQDVAKFEVLRLASEWEERMRRFPNCYGDPKSRIPRKVLQITEKE